MVSNKMSQLYFFLTTLIRQEYLHLQENSIIMSVDTFNQLNYLQKYKYFIYDENTGLINFYKLEKDPTSLELTCKVFNLPQDVVIQEIEYERN